VAVPGTRKPEALDLAHRQRVSRRVRLAAV
jgi:hypothetical protein